MLAMLCIACGFLNINVLKKRAKREMDYLNHNNII